MFEVTMKISSKLLNAVSILLLVSIIYSNFYVLKLLAFSLGSVIFLLVIDKTIPKYSMSLKIRRKQRMERCNPLFLLLVALTYPYINCSNKTYVTNCQLYQRLLSLVIPSKLSIGYYYNKSNTYMRSLYCIQHMPK